MKKKTVNNKLRIIQHSVGAYTVLYGYIEYTRNYIIEP